MKTLNKVFIAAIAATAMTACNNELGEQFVSNNGGDVKFTMGIEGTSASRVAMEDGSYQASFENENKVGVFVKEVDSYSNLEYTFDGNAWNGATIKVPADKVYTYYAYYPYAESATSTAVTAEVNADQETGGYLANDYLMANLTAEAGQANVDLQFTHALSLVEVTLSGPNAAEDAVVTLSNMTTDAIMNLEASTVTPGEKKANVTMDKLTTSMKYRAIVPEQTVAQGTALMTIVSKGRTYKVSYKASDVKFERGKYISLNVELGSSSSAEDVTVTITTSQGITDWGEGTPVTGDATVDEIPLILPLGDELTEVIKTFDLTSDAWAKFLDNAATYADVAQFSIGEDESLEWKKYASLEYTSKYEDANAANSYYKAALSYFHSSPLDVSQTKIYKLSMKIKTELSQSATLDGELSENGASKLVITCRNADNSSSFATSTNQTFSATTVSKTPGNRNWMDFIIYINLAQKSTAVGTVPTEGKDVETKGWKETSASDYAKFDLRFYTNNNASESTQKVVSKIYISDLVMEPYVAE
ncbi:MAG: fimbrillin family protein [Candidatus Phocaeicola faecipullorum]|nr:fimbrillin family protein [Candidatus Phocaeicola faecipullorum]